MFALTAALAGTVVAPSPKDPVVVHGEAVRAAGSDAAHLAKAAHAEGLTLREAATRSGHVSGEDFDRLVRPEDMV